MLYQNIIHKKKSLFLNFPVTSGPHGMMSPLISKFWGLLSPTHSEGSSEMGEMAEQKIQAHSGRTNTLNVV